MKLHVSMRLAVCAVAAAACIGDANAGEGWRQFRGPDGTGVVETANPPVEIGPEINVRWKVAVPSGLSSPIVVGELLIMTAFDGDKLVTVAYDRANGSEQWRATPLTLFQ
jgi:outer membrane protein assembly factor BamB